MASNERYQEFQSYEQKVERNGSLFYHDVDDVVVIVVVVIVVVVVVVVVVIVIVVVVVRNARNN